jgi:hypothetical protein
MAAIYRRVGNDYAWLQNGGKGNQTSESHPPFFVKKLKNESFEVVNI